jgi:glycosyltransferase involved in cell wall biosynthesis
MITVIVPTCERPHWISRCLKNLNGADEIIVSDDSDTDSTRLLVSKNFHGEMDQRTATWAGDQLASMTIF